jgi:hypothetical protein
MLVFPDPEDTCLHYNERAVLCLVTRSIFYLLFMSGAYQTNYVPYPSKVRYTPTTMGAQTPR